MSRLRAAAIAIAALAATASVANAQQCVNKAGEGSATTKDAAIFQAYVTVLQATDVGMMTTWMATGQKIGVAPGYQVSKLAAKCAPGGLGQTCRVSATLCRG